MKASRHLHRLRDDEDGATLVELALVVALLLLMFFMLLDFGRLASNWVMAEKATQMAARIAAVSPPVCAAVPTSNARISGSTAPFGTMCSDASGPCVAVATATCSGSATNATASRIFTRIQGLLPPNATAANLRYTYANDRNMNFVGGPYVPVVTVELQNLQFQFTSPLLGLARIAGAATTGDTPPAISFPPMSVSLPGEDLALGMNG